MNTIEEVCVTFENHPENDNRRRFYDSTAGIYRATFHAIWRFGFRYLHAWLREELRGHIAVLDAGAATGYWSKVIATDRTKRVIAMDFSERYVRLAKRFLRAEPNVVVVEGDITASPAKDRSFDAILCSGVLDTMPEPTRAFREFRRMLHDNGKLLLIIRSNNSMTSATTEKIIRATLFTFRFITGKRNESSMNPDVWQRTPLWPNLPGIAEQTGFRITSIHHGRMATNITLAAT